MSSHAATLDGAGLEGAYVGQSEPRSLVEKVQERLVRFFKHLPEHFEDRPALDLKRPPIPY